VSGFRRTGEREVHRGHVWRVVVAEFEAPDGEHVRARHRAFARSGGVVPLLFDPEGNPSVVLVEQYRLAVRRSLIEIPAGMRDVEDEPTDETAHASCARRSASRPAGSMHLTRSCTRHPGMTDQVTTIYLATDCTAVDRETHGPRRALDGAALPLDDALAMIDERPIRDAKTVIGLLVDRAATPRVTRRHDP
jgi:8-oxo-dGDP phosphatase